MQASFSIQPLQLMIKTVQHFFTHLSHEASDLVNWDLAWLSERITLTRS